MIFAVYNFKYRWKKVMWPCVPSLPFQNLAIEMGNSRMWIPSLQAVWVSASQWTLDISFFTLQWGLRADSDNYPRTDIRWNKIYIVLGTAVTVSIATFSTATGATTISDTCKAFQQTTESSWGLAGCFINRSTPEETRNNKRQQFQMPNEGQKWVNCRSLRRRGRWTASLQEEEKGMVYVQPFAPGNFPLNRHLQYR